MTQTLNYLGMDVFTSAYYECALWSSTDDNGTPLDSGANSDRELSQSCIDLFKSDCDAFRAANAALIIEAQKYQSIGHIAHDFWLTRNGHGAGFWDGDYPKDIGESLTKASKSFGECDLYIGDDGMIYVA